MIENIIQVFQIGNGNGYADLLVQASYSIDNDQYKVDKINIYHIKDNIVGEALQYPLEQLNLTETSILKYLTQQKKDT